MEQFDDLEIDLALQGHDHVISATYPLRFVPSDENFSNGVLEEVETTEDDGVTYYNNPEGTVFLLPNTGGTKEYDDIYSIGLYHVLNVRPRLDWMTEEDVEYYNNLFVFGNQPQQSESFETSHSNNRDSAIQNFAVYRNESNELLVELYQIQGELLEGEERTVELVYSFGITKGAE